MMEKDQHQLTETLLSLTLRIIYLLTGEEYVIEKKSRGCISGNLDKTQSNIREPSSHSRTNKKDNDQKILELTNRIVYLLTGEVPIRCQDVAVYFSMEEWEYLEEHKGLYQNVVTENLLTSVGSKNDEEIAEECIISDSSPECSNHYSTDEESISCEEIDISDNDLCKPTDHMQKYSSCTLNMEEIGCTEEDIINTDIYIPIDHEIQSPSTSVTGKLVSSEGQKHASIDIITIPDHSPTRFGVNGECDWSDHANALYQGVLDKPSNSINSLYHKPFPSGIQTLNNKDIKYNGSLCEEPFTKFFDHTVDHTDAQSFICSKCGKCLPTESDLDTHQKSHIKASMCSGVNGKKSFTRNPIPKPDSSGEEELKCQICGLCFSNRIDLVTHHQIHIKKPYPCSICGRGFYSRSGLVTHQKTHAFQRLYDCPTCGKTFISNAHLILHQKIHAEPGGGSGGDSNASEYQHFGSQDKLFTCSMCGECFYSSEHFLQHQKSHFKSDPLMCPDCGKLFMRKSGLSKHQRVVHRGDVALSCVACGKGFACKSELSRHMAVHSGQKPYTCTVCGKCFSFKSALVRHQRIHSGDRLHYCPMCGKGFSCNSELLRHQSVHQSLYLTTMVLPVATPVDDDTRGSISGEA
ncbi:oocyte zinc finger protein XlCOF7.1-like isoform X1 [Bufo bufo]|uniref:oocyte zinc finger protein XlCOF7.1-like isoform X1 n=2 Tax=Bufo bufo TaxID=8384 RepID=UPI001ABE519D|nr:oocyte zinc finger protein XlCOF7.1-like isoform X1 [Bufo bufo]XP_040291242.1 oocyte zinc finger protein XlCOF7.1-like isoform X1 [Bufo bufo]